MRSDPSWLMGPCPGNEAAHAEAKLWWAVVQQAALDLRYANRSLALDALDWLRGSGRYLVNWIFPDIYVEDVEKEIVGIVIRRNKSHRHPLRDSELRRRVPSHN